MMDSIIFQKSHDEHGRICGLEIGGMLVLENSQQLKKEFLDVSDNLSKRVKIAFLNVEDIDISCIQLFLAFIKRMNELHVAFQIDWELDEAQEALLENVGFSFELFMSN